MGWWPESVLCCVVCVLCPARDVGGSAVGCDAMMRESGCEAVRVALWCVCVCVCVDDVGEDAWPWLCGCVAVC